MINKKNLLGKEPDEVGIKDAIHTAIVAVVAGCPIQPGQHCIINQDRVAVPSSKGVGVADPFRKDVILRGKVFWLLLNQDEVPNVRHVWEHPTVDFSPPTKDVSKNKYLNEVAEKLHITYEQLMESVESVVDKWSPAKYPGDLTEEQLDEVMDDLDTHYIYTEWGDENLHEFENVGSACCPELYLPECSLFRWS